MSAILKLASCDTGLSPDATLARMDYAARKYLFVFGFTSKQIENILRVDGVSLQICRIMGMRALNKLNYQDIIGDIILPLASQENPTVGIKTNPIKEEIVPRNEVPKSEVKENQSLEIKYLSKEEIGLCAGLSEFLQNGIDTFQKLPYKPWQLRVDMMITKWNKMNPQQRVHGYSKKGELGNGVIWKSIYTIDSVEAFQKLFSVTLPPWLQISKGGRKKQISEKIGGKMQGESTQGIPILHDEEGIEDVAPISSFSLFGGRDALDAHSRQTAGLKFRICNMSEGNRPQDMRTNGLLTQRPKTTTPESKSNPSASMTKEEKVQALKDAIDYLNPLFMKSLEKYARGKTLTWRVDQFTGFPQVSSGFLEVQFEKNMTILTIKGCPLNEGSIWNAFLSKGFVEIMSKNEGTTYNEGKRFYNMKTETGRIMVYFSGSFTVPKISDVQSVSETSLEAQIITELKAALERNLNNYLSWYYKKHKKSLVGIDVNEFQIGRLSINWRPGRDMEIPTYEGNFPSEAQFGYNNKQAILEALHDVPEIRLFFSENAIEGFGLHMVAGDKKGISFTSESAKSAMKVIFRPY